MTTSEAKIRGSLLGLVWGDVLGAPIESWDAELIARVFGAYSDLPREYPMERIPDDPRIRGHLRPLGLHTDDTQQALALIHVCKSGWDVRRFAACLIEGSERGAWRGTGRFFRQAVKTLASGVAPERAGAASAGIGAAMRIAPVAALYGNDLRRMAEVVFESSCVTHADVRAAAIAYAVAAACALFIDGLPVEAVNARLAPLVREAEAGWVARFADWTVDFSHLHDVSDALQVPFAARDSGRDQPHNDPFALIGGVHALAVALRPEGTPAELLCSIMRAGGDTDTVGAIAGALLGARFGDDWIPSARIADEGRLKGYAQCLAGAALPETWEEFLRHEAAQSVADAAFRSAREYGVSQ